MRVLRIETTVANPFSRGGKIMSNAIEKISAAVHDRWMQTKHEQGVTSRKSETGEELMVPYEELSEAAKNLDRGTVEAVFAALPIGVLHVLEERSQQDAKWGVNDYHAAVWLTILAEEFGEVAKAVERIIFADSGSSQAREELIHVAAVALAWTERLDADA